MNRIKHAMNRRTYLKSRKLETWAQLNEPSKESKNDGEEEEDGDSDDGVWVLRANMHERAIESYEFVETLYEIGEKNVWRKKEWEIGLIEEEKNEGLMFVKGNPFIVTCNKLQVGKLIPVQWMVHYRMQCICLFFSPPIKTRNQKLDGGFLFCLLYVFAFSLFYEDNDFFFMKKLLS